LNAQTIGIRNIAGEKDSLTLPLVKTALTPDSDPRAIYKNFST
jgi:hypothetical protein